LPPLPPLPSLPASPPLVPALPLIPAAPPVGDPPLPAPLLPDAPEALPPNPFAPPFPVIPAFPALPPIALLPPPPRPPEFPAPPSSAAVQAHRANRRSEIEAPFMERTWVVCIDRKFPLVMRTAHDAIRGPRLGSRLLALGRSPCDHAGRTTRESRIDLENGLKTQLNRAHCSWLPRSRRLDYNAGP